jgi:hypothetical protein
LTAAIELASCSITSLLLAATHSFSDASSDETDVFLVVDERNFILNKTSQFIESQRLSESKPNSYSTRF